MRKSLGLFLFCSLFTVLVLAQEEQIDIQETDSIPKNLEKKGIVIQDSVVYKRAEINPLAPSKAAFYSAILPGLGQIYNRKYWKVPLVYGAIGTGIGVYTFKDKEYKRFRAAFKSRQAGFTNDEFYDGSIPGTPRISNQALESAQERTQRDRDLALLVTIGLYVLNIVDANVDSHLKQFNVDDNLSMDIKPFLDLNPINSNPMYGMAVTIKF